MQTQSRVVGSGYTTFNYRGKPIAFMESVIDSGQKAYGPAGGAEAVFTLDANRAREIVTGRVLDIGTINLSIRELWNAPVWYQLAGLNGVGQSITNVWETLAREPSEVTCAKIIKPPGQAVWRGTTFHNCVITDFVDGDAITLGALSVARQLTISYTHRSYFTQPAAA
jgi:hypothetical protein